MIVALDIDNSHLLELEANHSFDLTYTTFIYLHFFFLHRSRLHSSPAFCVSLARQVLLFNVVISRTDLNFCFFQQQKNT